VDVVLLLVVDLWQGSLRITIAGKRPLPLHTTDRQSGAT
jgi:hypothetical protein